MASGTRELSAWHTIADAIGVMHVATSFVVTYAITGSYTVAGVVTFVEPLVNTVMHHFFDEHWDHPRAVAARGWLAGHFSTKARSMT